MAFSNVLKDLGLLGKHIAVIGATGYKWVLTYFGTVNSNSVIVPIDKELPADDIAELLNRADASALVFDKTIYDRLDEIIGKCKNIAYYIDMSSDESVNNKLSFHSC